MAFFSSSKCKKFTIVTKIPVSAADNFISTTIQKQLFADVLQNRCSKKYFAIFT